MPEPYFIILPGGEFEAIPRPGEPQRIVYAFQSLKVDEGITHLTFVPTMDEIPEGALLPETISVHCLPKGQEFPTDPNQIYSLQTTWGQEPVPADGPFTKGLPQPVVVGVNTEAITSATGVKNTAVWKALLKYSK